MYCARCGREHKTGGRYCARCGHRLPQSQSVTSLHQQQDLYPSEIQKILKTTFGHAKFREYQEEIIQDVIKGNDVLAVLATGYGKSICYQVPALAMEGTAIVISPLISLMKDQVDALQLQGISAAFINSTQNFAEQEKVKHSVTAGRTDILYLAPERIVSNDMSSFLAQQVLFKSLEKLTENNAWCLSIDFKTISTGRLPTHWESRWVR